MEEFLIQLAGIFGFVFTVASYQCKNTRTCILVQAFAGICFTLNFFFLQSYTAALLNFLNILRNIILAFCNSEKTKNILTGIVFTAYLAAGVFTFGGIASLMATFAQLVGTLTMCTRNGKIYRLGTLLCVSPLWLVHNFMCGSVGGIITEIFTVVSILVFITRYGWREFFAAETI